MKDIKRERARPGSANLPVPKEKRSLVVEKQRFPFGFDCLLLTEANRATCLDCLKAGTWR
jgi:hypothetical protein